MIQYYCKQNKNEKSLTHGKWYAYPKAMSTITTANCNNSKSVVKSLLPNHNSNLLRYLIFSMCKPLSLSIVEIGKM